MIRKKTGTLQGPVNAELEPTTSIVTEKSISEIETWDDARLYSEIRSYIYDHVDYSDEYYYDVSTCFVLLTRRINSFSTCPYLLFLGPPASGKSRAKKAILSLVKRENRIDTASVTPAGLFHIVAERHPQIVALDESERVNDEHMAEMISLLNAGYERDTPAIRLVKDGKGNFVSKDFDVFGLKILASTRILRNEAAMSRCIIIPMQRRSREINFDIDTIKAAEIMDQLERYGTRHANVKVMKDFEPRDFGSDRLAQLFRPLFQVAPTIGVENSLKSLAATIAENRTVEDQDSINGYLFRAIRRILIEQSKDSTLDGPKTDGDLQVTTSRITAEVQALMQQDGATEKETEYWNTRRIGNRLSDVGGFYPAKIGHDRKCGFGISAKTLGKQLKRYDPI